MSREIISLQFGNYSNFVGTHFFNLQNPEELDNYADVDHSVWWQERRQGSRKVYTPRLIAVDLGENCISKRVIQAVGQGTEEIAKNNAQLWEGKVEEIHVGPDGDVSAGSGQGGGASQWKFEDGKDSWTDLCRWKIPPGQILHKIPNFSHNPEKKGICSYSQGQEAWILMEDDVSDGIRKYAEECDNLQGFHVLVDQDDGISGVCGGALQHLSDEYEKKCCFGIGVSPPQIHLSGVKDTAFRTKLANIALLWNRFNHHSSTFSSISLCSNIFSVMSPPRNVPLWSYKADSIYESSSLLAATLDSLWAPTRTTTASAISLSEVSAFLSTFGRKMSSICSSFPFPCDIRKESLFSMLEKNGLTSHLSLTPCLTSLEFEKASGNFFALNGLPDEVTFKDRERDKLKSWQQNMIKDINSCFTVYAQDSFCKSVNLVRGVKNATTVKYPFPTNVIHPSILDSYYVNRRYTRGVLDVWDLPSMTSAHNTSQNSVVLDSAVQGVGGSNARKVNAFLSTSSIDIELDDFIQCVDDLTILKEQYDVRFE